MTDQIAAFVLHPVLPETDYQYRAPELCLAEAEGLARAIGITPTHVEAVQIKKPRPATLFGAGKVDEIGEMLKASDPTAELVIVDSALTPIQHRNLERDWNVKVLDRTGLILEIFGARARTREGRLQVELAHLTYQRSRLVRSWTHLERQRGGAGFLGGPGERQIESDRRILAEKIDRLKKQLAEVKRTRDLQRRQRKRAPHPVVTLVGYTNAGKSTLFNRLTEATVLAADQLFATLDPTMRSVDLPSATRVIFSDTVGFISSLPTQLVAAFRATLEEVLEADIVLHVRDWASDDHEAQKLDVLNVLAELGIDKDDPRPVIEIWNKTDQLPDEDVQLIKLSAANRNHLAEGTISDPYVVPLSAVTGAGMQVLYDLVDEILTATHQSFEVSIPHEDGAALAWLHAHGEVLDSDFGEACQDISVRLSPKSAGQFEKQFECELHRL